MVFVDVSSNKVHAYIRLKITFSIRLFEILINIVLLKDQYLSEICTQKCENVDNTTTTTTTKYHTTNWMKIQRKSKQNCSLIPYLFACLSVSVFVLEKRKKLLKVK